MITLTCLLGEEIQVVEVNVTDPLTILKEKLDINDKKRKFIFKGTTYMVDSNLNFKDIGLTYNTTIFFNKPAMSGN
jgi:hypothetical protein